jgi:SAM-dependent methyltransferase
MSEDTENHGVEGSFVGQIRDLYEKFPYPSTFNDNPGRAIRSGSLLPAIDHYIFDGARDFSKPMRILVAGCGTGDALMDLGSQMHANRVPAEFMAVDLSEASLGIARERAARIGLTNIQFECKRLEELDPVKDGPFDYIDCSGVLHHLDDPSVGLNALVACLTEDGGIGAMVYGTLGRTGVYDVQRIISMLDAGPEIDQERVDRARALLGNLPRRNRLMTNPLFQEAARFRDDEIADAFLNPRGRAYTVPEIRAFLSDADLDAVSFMPPFACEPKFMLPAGVSRDQAAALSWWEQRELAELMSGRCASTRSTPSGSPRRDPGGRCSSR